MSQTIQITKPSRPRTFRRLSSENAALQDLLKERTPTVIVPPEHLQSGKDGKGMDSIAAAMELARLELEDNGDDPFTQPNTPPSGSAVTDKYAFAFDIDGVLIRGGKAIPEAVEAMKVLNGENEYGVKIPYIFVTNGGGKTEEERCVQLSKQLDIGVSPGQFICGHTPMREMADKYKTVLVIGGEGEKCREVAEGYGFRDVVTPGDIIKSDPHTTPFRKLTEEEMKTCRDRDFSKTQIEAIFVFADSRDWAGDQQIILDLMMSKGGYLGTRSETFDDGPPIYFSHNDIVWSAQHDLTRLGMGALRLSVEALFKGVTGKEAKTVAFGKPQIGTFQFATKLLQQWRRDTHGIDSPPDTVYFVGDTPESDIRGTNEYNKATGQNWHSILVETGVYQHGTKPTFEPKKIVKNVLEAVLYGIEQEQEKDKEADVDPRKILKEKLQTEASKLEGSAIADDVVASPDKAAA